MGTFPPCALHGKNVWAGSKKRARQLARRRVQQLGAGYRPLYHHDPHHGPPHYDIVRVVGGSPPGRGRWHFYILSDSFFYRPRLLPDESLRERGQAGRNPARRFAAYLRRQGFLPTQHFIERFLQRALAKGSRFSPKSFRREFFGARHYRQTRPGYRTRIALLRGIPILYRVGGRVGRQIVLVGVLPQGALPPVAPARPPRLREQESLLYDEPFGPIPQPLPSRRKGRVPRFTIGEIKGVRSAPRGFSQLINRPEVRGNTALVTYDDQGQVYMRVYKREPATGGRRAYWEGTIGRVPVPRAPAGSPARGNLIEDRIRRLLQRRTGQRFRKKHPSATGPDLVTRRRRRR